MADHLGTNDLRERPTSELLKQLSDQTTALVRQEIELAKLEFREKGKKAGLGAGMFGGAGVFGLYAVGALTATIILALATFLPGWVGALIVTVIYGVIAGVLALRGKARVKDAAPLMPEQAVDTTKEDVRWVKTRAQAARQDPS
jgi:MFS family permease